MSCNYKIITISYTSNYNLAGAIPLVQCMRVSLDSSHEKNYNDLFELYRRFFKSIGHFFHKRNYAEFLASIMPCAMFIQKSFWLVHVLSYMPYANDDDNCDDT
jgi:hypothetical protein